MAKRRRTTSPGGRTPMPGRPVAARGMRPPSVGRTLSPGGGRGVGGRLGYLVGGIGALALGLAVIVASGALDGPAVEPSGSPRTTGVPAATVSAAPPPTIDPAATGGPPISGILCDPTESVTYHVHAHLTIRFGGQVAVVPEDVGHRQTCLYWLHTHRDQGIIHVEAPAAREFALGQLFDVWGKVLTDRQVGDRALAANESLYIFLDGEPYAGDPRSIPLVDLRAIELQVGTEPFDPLPYTFPADFL